MPGCLGRSWPYSLRTKSTWSKGRPPLTELHTWDLQPGVPGHGDPGLTCQWTPVPQLCTSTTTSDALGTLS